MHISTGIVSTPPPVAVSTTPGPTEYFVDSVVGNDTTGNGSFAAPWKTIAKGNAAAAPGVTIWLNGNFTNESIAPAQSGTSTASIWYKGGYNAQYNSSGRTLTPAVLDGPGSNGYCALFSSKSFIVIQGITFTNSDYINNPVAGKGVVLRNASYITFFGCTFTNMQMELINSSYCHIGDINRAQQNPAWYNTWDGFVSLYVADNNGVKQPQTAGDMLHIYAVNSSLGSHDNTISGNIMSHAGHSLIEVGNGQGNSQVNANNNIHDNTLSNPWYKCLILSDNGAGTVVQNNTISDANSVPTLYSTVPGNVGNLQTSSAAVQFSGENYILRDNTITNAVATYGVVDFGGRWYYGAGSAPGGTFVESLNNQVTGNTISSSKGAAAFSFQQNYTPGTDKIVPDMTGNIIAYNAISGMTTSGAYSWDGSSHYETVIFRSFKGATLWTGMNKNQIYSNTGFNSTNAYRYSYVNASNATTTTVRTLSQFNSFDPIYVYSNS